LKTRAAIELIVSLEFADDCNRVRIMNKG